MAKSGQCSSHHPHPVHSSGALMVGLPSLSSRMQCLGQKAAHMPHDLHHARKMSMSNNLFSSFEGATGASVGGTDWDSLDCRDFGLLTVPSRVIRLPLHITWQTTSDTWLQWMLNPECRLSPQPAERAVIQHLPKRTDCFRQTTPVAR